MDRTGRPPSYYSTHPPQRPPPLRSNDDLNLRVLRRYNPAIAKIISLANYAVVYTFDSTTASWEKINIEGTLFICRMTVGELGEERYCIVILNRRSLINFQCLLITPGNVELTDEYVILKDDSAKNGENKAGANDYNIILECATRAARSMQGVKARIQAKGQDELHVAAAAAETQGAPTDNMQGGVSMGRTMSLKDMFGQQRAQDDEWSVRAHHEPPQPQSTLPAHHVHQSGAHQSGQTSNPNQVPNDVLGDLFRRAGLAPNKE
ncbi:Decapping enzyme Dcp1 [Penicillium verhagenii]|nr:Decapping enzyme Dcp1 [Penicillium verhagenii]